MAGAAVGDGLGWIVGAQAQVTAPAVALLAGGAVILACVPLTASVTAR